MEAFKASVAASEAQAKTQAGIASGGLVSAIAMASPEDREAVRKLLLGEDK